MARQLRVVYPGAIYHVMNRGDRREPIFRDDADRDRFLETLGEACTRSGWQVHALCLMPNHFHLALETPQPTLVEGMKWLLGTYTGRFNRRHKLSGHLFSGRYKSLVVDRSGTGYLKTVCDYVHLNPARARLLRPEQALREYRWSSWPEYLKSPRRRWDWLRVDRLLGEYRVPKDNKAGRGYLERCVEERRTSEDLRAYQAVRRGWCFGDKQFRKDLLRQVCGRLGPEHYCQERRETQEETAERVVAEELRRRRWSEAAFSGRAKGDREKVMMAVRLRQETLVTVAWIAKRLQMGSVANVNALLYHWRRGEERK